MQSPFTVEAKLSHRIIKPILAALFGLLVGGLFIFFTQTRPLDAYRALLTAGFGCRAAGNCAWWTTLQWATPLIFSGLAAAVSFRSGVFNLGQAGQMALGAAFAAWAGSLMPEGTPLHPLLALAVAAVAGAVWALAPGLLKVTLGVNEIISSLVMNQIAFFVIGSIPMRRYIAESARLAPLAAGTKFNSGFLLAVAALVLVFFFLFRSGGGFAVRMSGQAPEFARNAGMHPLRSVAAAMLISGALAGLGGAVEILGVHYHFVTDFSTGSFDGLVVALLGQTHPIGIFFSSIMLGGIRLGSLNGLLLDAGVPRELGDAMIAIMVIFMCADQLYRPILRLLSARWKV